MLGFFCAYDIFAPDECKAFAKLDKLERKIVEQEATAEAFTELNASGIESANVADQFAELAHKDAVDSELERLKGELGMA